MISGFIGAPLWWHRESAPPGSFCFYSSQAEPRPKFFEQGAQSAGRHVPSCYTPISAHAHLRAREGYPPSPWWAHPAFLLSRIAPSLSFVLIF